MPSPIPSARMNAFVALTEFAYLHAALQDNVWYYRDRAGLPRGPCQLSTMRAAWVHGIIDEYTLVWGQGLEAWYPVQNVVSLVANIQSYDGESPASPTTRLFMSACFWVYCAAHPMRSSLRFRVGFRNLISTLC